jgi:hypothetical protein
MLRLLAHWSTQAGDLNVNEDEDELLAELTGRLTSRTG